MDCGINIMSAVMASLPTAEFTPTRVKLAGPPTLLVETKVEVDFGFGNSGSGHLTMDWEHPTNIRRIRFIVSDGEVVTIDTVRGRLFRDGVVVQGFENSTNSLSQEYLEVYTDFARHIRTRQSRINVRPLQFVLDAYSQAQRTR